MKQNKPENIKQEDRDAVESPALSNTLLKTMRPVKKAHPNIPPRVRGAQKAPLKKPISLRLDQDIVEAFQSTGQGWQTRINAILHEWLQNNHDSRRG
jgi:uncharacterized protein (DUF4415 family)